MSTTKAKKDLRRKSNFSSIKYVQNSTWRMCGLYHFWSNILSFKPCILKWSVNVATHTKLVWVFF